MWHGFRGHTRPMTPQSPHSAARQCHASVRSGPIAETRRDHRVAAAVPEPGPGCPTAARWRQTTRLLEPGHGTGSTPLPRTTNPPNPQSDGSTIEVSSGVVRVVSPVAGSNRRTPAPRLPRVQTDVLIRGQNFGFRTVRKLGTIANRSLIFRRGHAQHDPVLFGPVNDRNLPADRRPDTIFPDPALAGVWRHWPQKTLARKNTGPKKS